MVEKFIQILQIRLSPRIVQMLVKRNPNTNKKKRNFKRFVWCSVYKIQEISYRNGVEISSFHSFTNHFRNISIFSENFIHNSDRSFRCINFHVAWKKEERGTGDVPEHKKKQIHAAISSFQRKLNLDVFFHSFSVFHWCRCVSTKFAVKWILKKKLRDGNNNENYVTSSTERNIIMKIGCGFIHIYFP